MEIRMLDLRMVLEQNYDHKLLQHFMVTMRRGQREVIDPELYQTLRARLSRLEDISLVSTPADDPVHQLLLTVLVTRPLTGPTLMLLGETDMEVRRYVESDYSPYGGVADLAVRLLTMPGREQEIEAMFGEIACENSRVMIHDLHYGLWQHLMSGSVRIPTFAEALLADTPEYILELQSEWEESRGPVLKPFFPRPKF